MKIHVNPAILVAGCKLHNSLHDMSIKTARAEIKYLFNILDYFFKTQEEKKIH